MSEKSQTVGFIVIKCGMTLLPGSEPGMDKPLPYIIAALICERVLREKDESLSIMRIADRIQYKVEGAPPGIKPVVRLQGLISVKSGPVTGEHAIRLVVEKPQGEPKEVVNFPMNFLGNDQGQNLILDFGLAVEQDGLYWFDVFFDDEMLTRIPLMITPIQEPAQSGRK